MITDDALIHFVTVSVPAVKDNVVGGIKDAVVFAVNVNRNLSELGSGIADQSGMDLSAGGEHSERARVYIIDWQHVKLGRSKLEHSVPVSIHPDPEIGPGKICIVDLLPFSSAPNKSLRGIYRLLRQQFGQFVHRCKVPQIQVAADGNDKLNAADDLQRVLSVIDKRIYPDGDERQLAETLLRQNCNGFADCRCIQIFINDV